MTPEERKVAREQTRLAGQRAYRAYRRSGFRLAFGITWLAILLLIAGYAIVTIIISR